MHILIKNIEKLLQVRTQSESCVKICGKDMSHLPFIENAFLVIKNGLIEDFGKMDALENALAFDETIDAKGKMVLPTWIDSHTHLVHAATREEEFVDRINGVSYEQIAANGGGILNSANKLSLMDEEQLLETATLRLLAARKLGTGVIEIKSGYGLSVAAELKMLRVIKQLKQKNIIPIKATFLGAHAYPLAYKNDHEAYIKQIVEEMIPEIVAENLAEYIDVFCEQGFFNIDETCRILEAGINAGLKPKIHANQLHVSGGVQVGVKYNAISVDHLESMGQEEIDCLLNSSTMPVLLPGAAFFLNMHYQPARKLIDAGLPIVLASDYNPGSCPSYNMNFVASLACTQMKMNPEEVINACTLNAAFALEMQNDYGSITIGKKASIMITKPMQSIAMIPYWFGESMIEQVFTA